MYTSDYNLFRRGEKTKKLKLASSIRQFYITSYFSSYPLWGPLLRTQIEKDVVFNFDYFIHKIDKNSQISFIISNFGKALVLNFQFGNFKIIFEGQVRVIKYKSSKATDTKTTDIYFFWTIV